MREFDKYPDPTKFALRYIIGTIVVLIIWGFVVWHSFVR